MTETTLDGSTVVVRIPKVVTWQRIQSCPSYA